MLDGWLQLVEPGTTVTDMSRYVPMAGEAVNKHLFMITAHRMEPRLLKPIQYIYGVGASIDEVSHGKNTIQLGIEIQLV